MFKEEIIGILGAIITYTLAYYGFLKQVEFLQFVSSFLAGVFTTYAFQHRLQIEFEKRKIKREDAITMRDEVYGPIFRGLSEILESMELVKGPEWEIIGKLKEMKNNYFFYGMSRDLKTKFYTLLDRLDKYQTIYYATQTMVLKKIRDAVKKAHSLDVSVALDQVWLRLEIEETMIDSITLERALLQEIRPNDFIKTTKKEWREDMTIIVTIGGQSKGISDFESLYEIVLDEIKGEPSCREEKKQRQILIEELGIFLDQIKAFVTVQ